MTHLSEQQCASWQPRPGCTCKACQSGTRTGIGAVHRNWRERKLSRLLPQPPSNFQYGMRCNCSTCRSAAQAEAEASFISQHEMEAGARAGKQSCGCAQCSGNHGEWEMESAVLEETNADAMAKAVEFNRKKSVELGWGTYFDDIVAKVLRLNFTPEESYFASLVADWQFDNGLTPDGMLGPSTWAKMKSILGISSGGSSGASTGSGAIPLINAAMPAGSTYTVSSSSRKYGTPDTIRALQWIATEWHKIHPEIEFGVRDISQRGGGKIKPHMSHRVGLDADLTLTVRSTRKRIGDSRRGSSEVVSDYAAYQHIALDFVNLVARNPVLKAQMIFFFDKNLHPLISKGKDSDTHYRHFHVRFCMPAAYQSLINFNAVYASGESKPNYRC